MNKEELLKALEGLPKVKANKPISTMDSVNVDDLMSAVDRFNKIPNYKDLLKENKKLKDNWNKLKEYIHNFPSIEYASIEKVNNIQLSGKLIREDCLLDKMQELEESDNNDC